MGFGKGSCNYQQLQRRVKKKSQNDNPSPSNILQVTEAGGIGHSLF
jgi:hypothetical protein